MSNLNPTEQTLFNQLQTQKQTLDQTNRNNKLLITALVFALVLLIWTSYSITNNPYSYPTRFWLYFMIGLVFFIVILMIDSVTNMKLIKTFQYALLVLSIVLNLILIINVYRNTFVMPERLINLIVLLNGFIAGYLINYTLNFNIQETTTFTASMNCPTPPPTMPMTTTMSTPMMTTPMMTTTPMISTTRPVITTRPPTAKSITASQLRSLDDASLANYDFGAFDPVLSEFRSDDGNDIDYFNDYDAQMEDIDEYEFGDNGYYEDDEYDEYY